MNPLVAGELVKAQLSRIKTSYKEKMTIRRGCPGIDDGKGQLQGEAGDAPAVPVSAVGSAGQQQGAYVGAM